MTQSELLFTYICCRFSGFYVWWNALSSFLHRPSSSLYITSPFQTVALPSSPSEMTQVHGNCSPRFEEVRTLFQQFIDSGEEVGASITVNLDGENVVDLWGGYADPGRTRAWNEDTIVTLFSTTKMICSVAVLKLIDSGAISVNDKVSKYWPEFAANGKEDIEIRHLLSHTSGVAGWDDKMTFEDVCDLKESTAKLAQQAPWWTPGTASAYHAWTFGHLSGELVRRVTGMSLKQFVADKISGPLGADFQIGALEKDWPRVADLVVPPPAAPEKAAEKTELKLGPLFFKAMNPMPAPGMSKANGPLWRQAELGAANGYGNARSVNRILSSITLAGNEDANKDQKPLFSRRTAELVFEEQSRGEDLAIGQVIRFGTGYAIRGDGDSWVDDWLPVGRLAYWGGMGGSIGIMDLDRGVTITYAMNKMGQDMIGKKAVRAYVAATYKTLGIEIKTPNQRLT
ncbi:beta-lactamase [Biscogniauxia marginata]|nr:beta-lactamase [Biscogniauxia marginata]